MSSLFSLFGLTLDLGVWALRKTRVGLYQLVWKPDNPRDQLAEELNELIDQNKELLRKNKEIKKVEKKLTEELKVWYEIDEDGNELKVNEDGENDDDEVESNSEVNDDIL